jgi:YD repeat-containing protein
MIWWAIAPPRSCRPSTHTRNDLNRLLEDDQFTYTYDNNGNLTTKTDKVTSQVTTYQRDGQDQLIQIDRSVGTTVTYEYNELGWRIKNNLAGSITHYVYDGEDMRLRNQIGGS